MSSSKAGDTLTGDLKVDRLSKGYEPRWDIDLAVGKEGESFVLSLFEGLEVGTIEVKTDKMAAITKNLYIEYECVGKPSGIQTSEADAWAFVIGEQSQVIIVPTNVLRWLYEQLLNHKKYCREMNRGARPTKGVVIPLEKFSEMCLLAGKALKEKK